MGRATLDKALDADNLDPGNLAFAWGDGRVVFANGRGGFSFYDQVSLAQALEDYNVYVAWVEARRKAGNASHADWTPPGMREVIIRAHGLAEQIAVGGAS